MLGHSVCKGEQKIFSGIGGAVLAYLHKTHIALNGIEFASDVYYSHEWDDMPFGAVWDFYCEFKGVPIDVEFIDEVLRYEKEVTSKR